MQAEASKSVGCRSLPEKSFTEKHIGLDGTNLTRQRLGGSKGGRGTPLADQMHAISRDFHPVQVNALDWSMTSLAV